MKPDDILNLNKNLISTWWTYSDALKKYLLNNALADANYLVDNLQNPELSDTSSDYIIYAALTRIVNNNPQEALNMVKDAFVYGFRGFWKFNPNSRGWCNKESEDYILLKALHENTLIQEYVRVVCNSKVEPRGFDVEKTPFCWFEKAILNRKNVKCEISNKKLEKGIEVYQFRFFNGSSDIPGNFFVADIESFHSSKEAMQNLRKYKENNYRLSDFAFKVLYRHPLINAFWNRLDVFNLQETIRLIANPPVNSSPYVTCYFYESLPAYLEDGEINYGTGGEFLDLLYVLIKCGYLEDILSMLPELPEHFPITLMCFEMEYIREKVSSYLGLPGLPEVYSMALKSDILKKPQEVKQIIEFGMSNPDFRRKLATSLNLYEYHLYSNLRPGINWFFQDFKNFTKAGGGKLLIFLVAEPELIPSLKKMKENFSYPEGIYLNVVDAYENSLPYLYQAITLNAALYDIKNIKLWIEMPAHILTSPYYNRFKVVHEKTRKIIEAWDKTNASKGFGSGGLKCKTQA